MIKTCKVHGPTDYFLPSNRGEGWRCKRCASEAVKKARAKRKAMLVGLAGGACVKCGYNRAVSALDFHHVDPVTKSFSLSHPNCKKLSAAIAEIKKCVLVCANCHREIENGITTVSDDDITRQKNIIEKIMRCSTTVVAPGC